MYHQNSGSHSHFGKKNAHLKEKVSARLKAAIICLATLSSTAAASWQSPAAANPATLTTPSGATRPGNLVSQSLSDRFANLPPGTKQKHRPTDVKIYELDHDPLGSRSPFLMVHGLRGEYYPYFRWQKVAEKLAKSEDFNSRYKIYLVRYSSLDRIDNVLPKFKEAINSLYIAGKERPIAMMALSMGGNISYEALTDPNIESKVRVLFTMGTPFHGSPLFCKDWMNYTVYKRLSWPWTRIDHNLALKLYFGKNPTLRQDLTWDNADETIPEVGGFWSKLPFGPSGKLTIADTINERLIKVNSRPTDRQKLICYGGYIVNPYMTPGMKRYLESAFLYPLFLLSTSFPAHFAREHPVLDLLNRDITNIQVTKKVAKQAGTPYVYVLNDGITPVTSAIFLPPNVAREQYIARETDFEKVRGRVDVRQARVFRNVDHLTFIDGVRPVNTIINATSGVIRDELNPQDGQKDIFDWILGDILSLDQNKLVKERKDNDNKDKLGQTTPAATSPADAVNQEAAIPMVQPQ
jgi:PGAP1-like protein